MNTTDIDIYADKPEVTLDYMIEVMKAANAGQPLQFTFNDRKKWLDLPLGSCIWDWPTVLYRINPSCRPSPIASGHNPDKLTEEQVGVKHGRRLLTPEEINSREHRTDIKIWTSKGWLYNCCGDSHCHTYCTNRPVGYFLPKKKAKVPLKVEDLPGLCWIKWPTWPTLFRLVIARDEDSIMTMGSPTYSMLDLALDDILYSSDCKNWFPCYKEIEV